jgi:hypothetical protein
MLSSLFIKTYEPDLKWLEWSLKFLDKNWQDISTLSIVAPANCLKRIEAFGCELKPTLFPMEEWSADGYRPEFRHVAGYLGQQYMKMVADCYCEGDFITFIDSDAMLTKPTILDDLLGPCDRPIIWTRPYGSSLGDANCWKRVVTQALMLEPELEFMRCHPFTYHRETLKNCRAHLERLHCCSLREIINRSAPTFSEFNVLGFYAYVFESGRYDFRDDLTMGDWGRIRQFHSYSEWNDGTPALLRELLGHTEKICETVERDPLDNNNGLVKSDLRSGGLSGEHVQVSGGTVFEKTPGKRGRFKRKGTVAPGSQRDSGKSS